MVSYLCVLGQYVLLGMCGQNSFAQAGLWGVGAYIAGNVLTRTSWGFIPGFVLAIIVTAIAAFILGVAFFRLKQYYFTFASIGLMTILSGLFMNEEKLTGGTMGMKNIPTFQIGSFSADTGAAKYFVIIPVCIIATIIVNKLFNTALGRSFMTIRDNEMTADSLGINSLVTKSIAFAISGALCGAAGSMYASLSGYLSPYSFTYAQSTIYLIMVMVGGTMSPIGAMIGTAIITFLQEGFRDLQEYMQLVYGVGVILLMIFQPEGILGGGLALYERIKNRKEKARSEAY